MQTDEQVIAQTKKWVDDVVIGCNFCPFAAQVVKQQTIYYRVEHAADIAGCLQTFQEEMEHLDADTGIETVILIFPDSFPLFDEYLDLVADAEDLLVEKGYEGIYQVASFHPQYLFEGAPKNDAANYTNRSVYPMLHLLREASIDKALENYKQPEKIPERNIQFARKKGWLYMKQLKDNCWES